MNRRGLVLSLFALVAVLAVAFVGYNVLRQHTAGTQPAAQTATAEQSATEPEQDAAEPEQSADDAAGPAPEQDAPLLADYDATVYTQDGEAVTLTQIAGGMPLVINYWATWCPYCIEEMPDLQAIVHDYDGRVAFAFIDAADGQRETVEIASTWLSENGFDDLPAYYDTDYAAVSAMGVRAFPTTVVVSASGEIAAYAAGMVDPNALRTLLDELL